MSTVNNLGAPVPGVQGPKPTDKAQNRPAAGDKPAGADFASELQKAVASPVNTEAAAQGLNSLINTNLETEAAKQQALQLQQKLGAQDLGIVNQRASMLLSLFNNK